MANDLLLDILGTSFTITADEDEAYLKKVLAQYRSAIKNTQNISGITDPLNVAILTGFLLCDEFNKVKDRLKNEIEAQNVSETLAAAQESENQWEEQEVEERTLRLIHKLEQALHFFGDEKDL